MTSTLQPRTSIKLKGHRKRQFAESLRNVHAVKPNISPPAEAITVVCISDTHNTRPEITTGDILIHAGDLTENGSFDEVQAELSWLSSQPHTYKILIAGNHDVLLDEAFLSKYPERRYGQTKTKDDLEWGSVIYLQDSSVTLEFPSQEDATDKGLEPRSRKLVVFGSPWTPQYGLSAFQYRPDDETHWAAKFASLGMTPDIVVTHGPSKHHLDARDFYRAGCPYLAEEIARIRPRLLVFGHIHASYGREDVVLDGVQRSYEEVMTGWSGWESIVWMAILVVLGKIRSLFPTFGARGDKTTTFVNAAVVGGAKNDLRNPPIIVKL